ncbi:MAG: hypothetical protein E7256_17335 [Lachnospiraceae bacterium]|nr:hypothetical protein [Lachnospiraceae bacterium]
MTKVLTSAAANKWIKTLEDEKSYYLSCEAISSVYTLAEGEEEEKPEYDYKATRDAVEKINETIRKIRHAVNVFNTTTLLPSLGITIDEALVKMAQLNARKQTLDMMRKRLPKDRVNSFMNRTKAIVEYQYTNYEIGEVNEDYKRLSQEIVDIQLALDICNQTQTFEIEMEE